ncbi:MliC family protein [Martelella soudanensis]|uniref:MliC family protein n=1 Tax=unclassified Martelella TaxID=2629616 RepID=UPI0015DFF4DF|nr:MULTISPECIES: MliC family protein [unclassified Martelella]
MKAAIFIAISISLAALHAKAEDKVSLALPEGTTEISASYDCGDFTLDARYINGGQIALAELQWPDNHVIAANVIAASGARYAAGPYVWWSKGNDGTLYNVTKGENDPGIACTGKS